MTPDPPSPPNRTGRWRGLPALIAAQISLHSGITGLRVVGPLLLLDAGGSVAQVGVMIACFAVGPVAIAWWVGGRVDALGYRPPMRVALVLAAAALSVAGLATAFEGLVRFSMLCVSGAVGGAAANTGLITLQRTAARMARDAAALRGTFAWVGIAPSASNVAGPLAAGLLFDLVGARGALVGLLTFPLLAALIARAARPPDPPTRSATTSRGTPLELLRNPTVRRMLVIDALITGGWDAHTFLVPTLGHARGLSATAIGVIYGLFGTGVVAVRATIPWFAHRMREPVVLAVSMVATATLFALYALGESAVFMGACAFALGMTIGLSQPMVLSVLHQSVAAPHRGSVIALRTMSVNLNAVMLPVALGAALAAVGAAPLLWAMAVAIGGGTAAVRTPR